MFPVPIVPGTLPLVGHRVTSKPQQVVGAGGATPLQYARHQDVCPGRQGSSSPRMHTGHRMRTTGTHTGLRSPRPVATCRPPPTWRLLNGKDRQGGVEVEELQQPEGDQGGRGFGEI